MIPNFEYVEMADAPVVLGRSDLEKVLPLWSKITWDIQADPEAVQKFGWVLSCFCCLSVREERNCCSQLSALFVSNRSGTCTRFHLPSRN